MPAKTRIPRSKTGPPRDLRDSGPAGELKTYTLSPEELERYRALPKPTDKMQIVMPDGKPKAKEEKPMPPVEQTQHMINAVDGMLAEYDGNLIIVDADGNAKPFGSILADLIAAKSDEWKGNRICIHIGVGKVG